MIKKLFVAIIAITISACSSQDQFDNDRYEVIESPAQQSIEFVRTSKFEESDGVLQVRNKSWGLGPRDHLERFSKLDPISTRYYYMKNNSDQTIEGILDVNIRNTRTFDENNVIVGFVIGPNQKVLVRKTIIEKYEMRVLKARFVE